MYKKFDVLYMQNSYMTHSAELRRSQYEILLFTGGYLSLSIGRSVYNLKEGYIVLLPPDAPPHMYNVHNDDAKCAFWDIYVDIAYYDRLLERSDDYGYIMRNALNTGNYVYNVGVSSFEHLKNKAVTFMNELNSDRFGKDVQAELFINDLLLSLNRYIYEALYPDRNTKPASLIQNILQYIDVHIAEELSLDILAERFSVNRSYLSHYFKHNLNTTPHKYILKKNIALSEPTYCLILLFRCFTSVTPARITD